ncbi:MAG: NepR family anti-sigma factor [Pseudomonadota bacterium]
MAQEGNQKKQRFEALVDDNLKRLYSDLVQEELPDRFKDLLSQLKDQDTQKSAKK